MRGPDVLRGRSTEGVVAVRRPGPDDPDVEGDAYLCLDDLVSLDDVVSLLRNVDEKTLAHEARQTSRMLAFTLLALGMLVAGAMAACFLI